MHLLTKNTFDIQCFSTIFGKEMQSQLGFLLEKEFYPKLEILFNQYDQNNIIWSIDFLKIDLEKIEKKHWKEELIRKSLLQIENYLKLNKPFTEFKNNPGKIGFSVRENQKINDFISDQKHAIILFFDFLKTGILEENSISQDLENLIKKIEINLDFANELIEIFQKNNDSIVRWIFSVPNDFKEKIYELLSIKIIKLEANLFELIQTKKLIDKNILSISEKIEPINRQLHWFEFLQLIIFIDKKTNLRENYINQFLLQSKRFWDISNVEIKTLLRYFEEIKNDFEPEVIDFYQSVFKNVGEKEASNFPGFEEHKLIKQTSSNKINFIENAGLVILHPFLKTLFEKLELCKNDIWTTDLSLQKAILLTQYLITGNEKIQENELLLNKIICGCDINKVINTQLKISDKEKQQCNNLLEAVLQHWNVMSKSSITALQETFLQRKAKLEEIRENYYEIWVEEKGYDILLEQLPWGIGMVKTPWMQDYLICNW